MERTIVGLAITAALFLRVPELAGQICAGFPTEDGQFSLGGSLDFTDGGDLYGFEGSLDLDGRLSVFAGLDVFSPEGPADSQKTYSTGAAVRLLSFEAGGAGDTLSVCPTARIRYADTGSGSVIDAPIGIGFGTVASVSPTIPVMPYAIPQVVVSRFSYDDDALDSSTEIDLGFRGGILLRFGPLFLGAELDKIFREGSDVVFGIRAGIRL